MSLIAKSNNSNDDDDNRAFNKTLLAKLGGGDEDRRHPLHDLACQYLCTKTVVAALWSKFVPKHPSSLEDSEFGTQTEVCIGKGEGQYKTTIGFVDASLGFPHFGLRCEVKIGRVPISEAIRQIKLYRSYQRYDVRFRWLLVTPWPLTVVEKETLENESIGHVLLGEGFERFCALAKEAKADQTDLSI